MGESGDTDGAGDDLAPRPTTSTFGEQRRPSLRAEMIATERNATELRRRFSDWLTAGTTAGIVDDLALGVYEALANAVEHAYAADTDAPGPVRLDAARTDDEVLVTVTDRGGWRIPSSDGYDGRGLALIRCLIDEVTVDGGPFGTTVHLRAKVSADPPPR